MNSLARRTDTNPPGDAAANAHKRLGDVVAKLYPTLTERERAVAALNLLRYFEIVLAIAEEGQRSATCLTHRESVPSMKERSNGNLKT